VHGNPVPFEHVLVAEFLFVGPVFVSAREEIPLERILVGQRERPDRQLHGNPDGRGKLLGLNAHFGLVLAGRCLWRNVEIGPEDSRFLAFDAIPIIRGRKGRAPVVAVEDVERDEAVRIPARPHGGLFVPGRGRLNLHKPFLEQFHVPAGKKFRRSMRRQRSTDIMVKPVEEEYDLKGHGFVGRGFQPDHLVLFVPDDVIVKIIFGYVALVNVRLEFVKAHIHRINAHAVGNNGVFHSERKIIFNKT